MDAQIRSRDPRRFHHLMEQFPQYQVKDSYNVQSLDDLWPLPSQIHTGQHMSFERSPPMPFLHTTGGSSEASYSKPHSQAVDDETKSETGSIDSRFCDIEDCNDKCGDDCEEECDDTCSVVKCNGDCNPNEHVDNCEDCLRYNETTCENKDCMINDYGGCKPCNEICTGMELTDCVSSHGPVCYSPNCDIPPPEQCSFSSCFPTEVHSQSGLLEGRTADMVTINHDFSLDYRFPSNYQFSVQSSIEDQYSIDGRPRKRRRAETPLTVQTQNHPPSRASNMIEQDNPSNSHLASPVMHNQYSYLCQWGDSCQMGFMDYYALDDHVMEAHIRSQSGFSCQWAACREAEKDLTQLVDHVRSSHTSNSCQDDEHICLWQGCNTTLSTSEELGHHLTDVHLQSPIGGLLCEWEACGIQTDGPDGLTTHLHRDHFVPALPEHSGSSSFNSTSLSSPTEQDLLCQWCETEGGEICGKRFTTADALQLHAKDYHISKLKKKTGYFCLWAGCTRRDKEFSQKGKVSARTDFSQERCYPLYTVNSFSSEYLG